MELIIGGAYQGKRAYAMEHYGLTDADIYTCTEDAPPDRSCRCIDRVENYVRYCVRQGITPDPEFRPDAVVICREIFSGIVPMDPEVRLWREETGRFLTALSRRAGRVTRLFCGLPQVLK